MGELHVASVIRHAQLLLKVSEESFRVLLGLLGLKVIQTDLYGFE